MIFLRPWFLLLFLLIPIFYIVQKKYNTVNPWKKLIKKDLAPFVIQNIKAKQSVKTILILPTLVWVLLTIALAGPTFKKIEVSSISSPPATIIVADLNNVSEKTLPQLKIKILEILKRIKTQQVALVLFDEKGYVAVPLTQDTEIIAETVPSLHPSVLPITADKPENGFEKAIEILKNANQQSGRILFLTAATNNIEEIQKKIKNTNYQIGILGLNNNKIGEPVLNRSGQFKRDAMGQLMLAKIDEKEWKKVGAFVNKTNNNDDVELLLDKTKESKKNTLFKQIDEVFFGADVWEDAGIWFVFLALPLCALFFRKGMFFIVVLFVSNIATASIWLRDDQEAYIKNKESIENYRAKNYEQALKGFQTDKSETGIYNQGNALAHLGKFKEAISQYEKVLKTNPNHKEAKFNKEYLEKLLQENENKEKKQNNQNEQNKNDEKSNNQEQENQQPESKKENNNTQENNQNDITNNNNKEEQSNQNKKEQNNQSQQNQQPKETETQENKNQESESVENNDEELKKENPQQNGSQTEKNNNPEKEQAETKSVETEETENKTDQETMEIFNRLKKDPYRLLRYRLKEQYRRNP